MNKLKHNELFKAFIFIAALGLLFASAVSYAGDGTKEINVDGLKVIIKNTGKDVISARLFITGGTANYPLEKQGIEALTYNVVIKGGTASLSKNEFFALAEKMGTVFGSNAALDYGEINVLCLKESWDKSWELFSDAILNPAFSSNEFANKKEQFISYAKQNEADPDGKLDDLVMTTAFKGKNYEKNPQGSSESLSLLTLEDLKSYYSTAVCKNRAFLVVAGNVDRKRCYSQGKSNPL
jgi:predicted Zn-dependent peptidase